MANLLPRLSGLDLLFHKLSNPENAQRRLFPRSQPLKTHDVLLVLDPLNCDCPALAILHQSSLSSLARKRCPINRKLHCHRVSGRKAQVYRAAKSSQRHAENFEIGYIAPLLTFYRPITNKSTAVTILAVLVELIADWSGAGAGGPFVSPAMAGVHRALHRTQTNATAFSVFNIGTSDIAFS